MKDASEGHDPYTYVMAIERYGRVQGMPTYVAMSRAWRGLDVTLRRDVDEPNSTTTASQFAETLRKKLPIWKELYAPYGRSRYARHDNQDSVTNARRHQAADYGAWRNEQGLAAPSGAKTTTPTTSKALPPPARNTYRQPYNPSVNPPRQQQYYTAQPQPRDQPYFSQPRQQANQLPPQAPPKPKELSRNPAQTFHAEAEGPETLENTPEENPQAYYADVEALENDDPLDDYEHFVYTYSA